MFRFSLRFDETDPDHRQVCEFLNACGRKKARYVVKAILAYWESQGSTGTAEKKAEAAEKEMTVKEAAPQKTEASGEKAHLVSLEEEGGADEAEINLMLRNYQMFEEMSE